MNKKLLPLLSVAPFVLLSWSHAATITWGSATTISGDSDVSTDGTLVVAASFGTTSASIVVNGVTFAGGGTAANLKSSATYGTALNYTSAKNSDTAFGTASTPFSSLSANYQDLLTSGLWETGTDPEVDLQTQTFTFGGTGNELVDGQEYQIQIWAQDARNNKHGGALTIAGTGGVTLNYTDTSSEGGLGQYVIGTFTADADTQS
ncbi:hypothetical protein QEH52_10475, partial [Coraliomargarita sp. SDUM461003]